VDRDTLKKLLTDLRQGKATVQSVERLLRHLPAEDLGFATIDTHRAIRRGFPETVYGEGKTAVQIAAIVDRLARAGQTALVTRVGPEAYDAVRRKYPQVSYRADARALVLRSGRRRKGRPGVVILTAGTTDIPVAEEAALTAELMGEEVRRIFDVGIAGLHRLLSHRDALSRANVVIAVAGMEGALPSVVAGLVDCPVIAVPTSIGYGTGAGGFAALLTMLNSCASGVAVVNIDNGHGAGCLASLINRRARKPSAKTAKRDP
jgi:pyridinium-3,5-biscarboxylic acid mononucleotide synthase